MEYKKSPKNKKKRRRKFAEKTDTDFVKNGTFSQNGRQNRTSRSQLCPFSSIKTRFALTATRFVKNPSQKPEILTISRRPKKIIVKTVGQNFKNRPPVAPNQFLDPSYRTAASPRLRFTPPNIPKTSPESSFDHPDPHYITQPFQKKKKTNKPFSKFCFPW